MIKVILVSLLSVFLYSCAATKPNTNTDVVLQTPLEVALSPLPLNTLTKVDYKFAQSALKQLGYKIGTIDGIWGPRSASAIRQFENDNQLITANGRLSELNYTVLSELTTLNRDDFVVQEQPFDRNGIASKLDKNIPLSESPQLIITDLAYTILAKPNPYSKTLALLPKGSGLYIINLQEGWYEVETLERQRGYINKK